MRIAITSFLIFLNFILQSTAFAHLEIFGIRPNTSLIIVVCFSILRTDGEGAVIGFSSGLLHDIAFGKALGFYALLGMTIGFVCGKLFKDFYRENYLLPLFLVVGASFFYEFSVYIFTFLFRGRVDIFYYIRRIIIPAVCYNAFLTFPLFRLVYSINGFIESRENPRIKLF